MDFADVMTREGSVKQTENGAKAYNTAAAGDLLDFFSQAGALRPCSVEEIQRKFAAAYREDHLLATKALFYTGDIRQGGLGERRTFRACLKWMAQEHPSIVKKNLKLIPIFNRFDSWFELIGTPCEGAMWEEVAKVLAHDLHLAKQDANAPITLLAKWMPSENTSSQETRRLARRAMDVMGLRPREYRKMLSKLRKHINVVESFMSAGNWDKIDYAKVPSYAMHNYGSAFAKHDYDRFNGYMQSVKEGTAKINASVLFPYDLTHRYLNNSSYFYSRSIKEDAVVEAQWKALPNYVTKSVNAVVMADVSGSMSGRPMETSIGLAIYFAQHNTGRYHNKYMTFSGHPEFINIKEGASLAENVGTVLSTGVGYNTNLSAAFDRILADARQYGVSDEDMPKALVVISDMEIDSFYHPSYGYGSRYNLDFVQRQKKRFAEAGYTMPKLILWNVEARNDTYLSQDSDVILLSGQSASTFKSLCQNLDGVTAYEMMVRILNSKAYDCVTI